jgi:hypothetical protein
MSLRSRVARNPSRPPTAAGPDSGELPDVLGQEGPGRPEKTAGSQNRRGDLIFRALATGANFLTSPKFETNDAKNLQFGIRDLLVVTLLSSLVALLIAVPVAIAIAIFLTNYAPRIAHRSVRDHQRHLAGHRPRDGRDRPGAGGDIGAARHHLDMARRSAELWQGTAWEAATLEAEAHVWLADDNPRLARQLLGEARGLFEAARQPLDAARCNQTLADLGVATDETAEAAPPPVPAARRAERAQRT